MAFTTQMVNLLKSNASVRHELMALKLAQNAEKRAAGIIKGVKPTKESKQIVNFLEREEKRVMNSKEAKHAFDQVVKPETRYAATEDCFNRGYMLEDSFWNDCERDLNLILRSREHAGYYSVSDYLRRVFIDPMKKIRAQQGEVPSFISQKGLRIDLPLPKQKATAVSEIVSGAKEVTKNKRPGVVPDKLESFVQSRVTRLIN